MTVTLLADTSLIDVLLLRDWNTRVVVIGTVLLGLAAGMAGTLLVLRKRALLGDTVAHAMLPGVVAAFLVMQAAGGTGKHFVGLLAGATIAGVAGAWAVPLLRRATRLRDDAVMGVVLGSGFGLGIAMLGIVQGMPGGNQAGLLTFIYGKTASMIHADAVLIGIGGLVVLLATVLLAKDFRLLCFDEAYASTQGRPVGMLDLMLMTLAVVITVIGLQAVGLILVIAMLIIPASAARFWTDGFNRTMMVAAGIGGLSCWMGASISAVAPDLPAGAVIVLTVGAVFLFSMMLGTRRGVVLRFARAARLRRRTGRQHLLRAMFEVGENHGHDAIEDATLARWRRWSRHHLHRLLGRAVREGLVQPVSPSSWRLTDAGRTRAEVVVRNHRLWELFLIQYAHIAPSHVDRDADEVEHVLSPDIIEELERLLHADRSVPPDPHGVQSA